MKNDEILKLLTKIDAVAKRNFTAEQQKNRANLTQIDDAELNQLYNETDKDLAVAIEYAIRTVRRDIAKASIKSKPEKDRLSGLKFIMKTAKSVFGYNCFERACIMDDKMYITNTTCAVILDTPMPLETCYPNQTWCGIKDKIHNCYNNVMNSSKTQIIMPDKTKLDAYIKTEKARNKQDRMKRRIDYNFGEGFPKVNAEILSAMLDVFPDNPAFISAFDPERSAIIFTAPANITDDESDNSIGVLLPVMKNKAESEAEATML